MTSSGVSTTSSGVSSGVKSRTGLGPGLDCTEIDGDAGFGEGDRDPFRRAFAAFLEHARVRVGSEGGDSGCEHWLSTHSPSDATNLEEQTVTA